MLIINIGEVCVLDLPYKKSTCTTAEIHADVSTILQVLLSPTLQAHLCSLDAERVHTYLPATAGWLE